MKGWVEHRRDEGWPQWNQPNETFSHQADWALNCWMCVLMDLRVSIRAILRKVDAQANDEGLWFIAETAPEAYLQGELRELHRIIEEE